MNLSESFKNRNKKLAGLPIISESMHPQFMDFGFYDICNGNVEVLHEELESRGIDYTYDGWRNFTKIITSDPKGLQGTLLNARAVKVPIGEDKEMFEDPNDCVLVQHPPINVPPGAML